MLNAMSQGRSGSMATVHADDSAGVFRRLAAYAVQAPERLPLEATNLLIAGAIHLVVHLDTAECPTLSNANGPFCREASRTPRPSRRIASVREVVGADGPLVITNEVWKPGPDGRAVPPHRSATRRRRSCRSTGTNPHSGNRSGSGDDRLLIIVASVGGAGLCLVVAGCAWHRWTRSRVQPGVPSLPVGGCDMARSPPSQGSSRSCSLDGRWRYRSARSL